jgi:hypothetical protein
VAYQTQGVSHGEVSANPRSQLIQGPEFTLSGAEELQARYSKMAHQVSTELTRPEKDIKASRYSLMALGLNTARRSGTK